jgi:hypothetical protein
MTTDNRVSLPVTIPPDATDVVMEGPRPFLTRISYRLPDGTLVKWAARDFRKADDRPRGLTWWIGLLFAIGSACFTIGPIPAYEQAVGATATGLTYFVGSLFFTTAAYLSYMQVVRGVGRRWFGWTPGVMGFWACGIQLVGTLYFNVTTFASLLTLDQAQAERAVWRPDAIGSVCFLVSSAIAFAEAGHRWFSWRPGKRDWHITSLNWWGSVFFGISAIGAYILTDDEMLNARWSNAGTFLGGVCFLVASLLMLPEGRKPNAEVG